MSNPKKSDLFTPPSSAKVVKKRISANKNPKTRDSKKSRTHTGRFTNLDPDKLRGGYYTSTELASWLCRWAIRKPGDFVLEPSCGDGSFLSAAACQLSELGAKGKSLVEQLRGVEILSSEAEKARARLTKKHGKRASDSVETSDFFSWWNRSDRPLFDSVVGNPPFIRYQSFPEPHRSLAMEIMKSQGLLPNRLTNIWVPFVVAAAVALKPGGRMALVLPAELLQVSYAAQLRSFLTDRFARIDLITCNELFFQKAEQEVLILLADRARSVPSKDKPCKVSLTESTTVGDILKRLPNTVLKGATPKIICHDSEKWLKYFLNPDEIAFMRELRVCGAALPLNNYAAVNVGVVTGKNQFFVLRKSEVEARGLKGYTMPLISRSAHLTGAKVDKLDWERLATDDQLVNMLHLAPFKGTKPKNALRKYILHGEENQVHEGYKCSIRDPWYAVPSVWIPDAFVFRQIYDFPRVVLNDTEATSTDTIHRMRCKSDNPYEVVANTYTSLTASSAEIEGRSYGGGVLELEPSEAERLLMPAKLGPTMPLEECDRLVRAGRLKDVLDHNDRTVLQDTMGLSASEVRLLRNVWLKMRDRRTTRRRSV